MTTSRKKISTGRTKKDVNKSIKKIDESKIKSVIRTKIIVKRVEKEC